jgi:hypothetical protein
MVCLMLFLIMSSELGGMGFLVCFDPFVVDCDDSMKLIELIELIVEF